MAHNHVAANLLMMVFVVGGLIIGQKIKQEVFPEISLDTVQVSVPYPGASPEEVEKGIILKVEENVSGVDGIKEIKSVAAEGVGTVTAVVQTGEDADQVLQNIKSEVDRITTLPEDAEKPVITKLLNLQEVISVVVYGDASERSLREWAESIRDDFLDMEEITQAELVGVRPYEISVEIPEENLRRYNLTLEEVAQRVGNASQDLPGGSVKTAGGEILIRTKERRYYGPGYENIIVLVKEDGTTVKLSDIATVKDSFEETDTFALFDGKPAARVAVFRVGEQKPTVIADIVHRYVNEKRDKLPDSIKIAVWNDSTELLESRLNLLEKNAAWGLVLVFITLGMFLQIRLALWVMLGIPISFLGAVFVMPVMGVSINMITLFAFIMALGIVVDDAIVIGENVYEHRQRGKPYLKAAVDGAREVGVPVIFSVLTTVAAFLPLIFVIGTIGKFIKVIPLVVISILLVSLVESLFVLPAHLSLGSARNNAKRGLLGAIDRGRARISQALEKFVTGPYKKTLGLCLEYRYTTLATALAILLLSFGLIAGGIIKFRFMPAVDGDLVLVDLKMPRGTLVGETAAIEKYITEKGREVVAEYDAERPEGSTILRHIFSVVGGSVAGGGPTGPVTTAGSHQSTSVMFLEKSEDRGIPAAEIASKWRNKVGSIPGIDSLVFTTNLVQFGKNIDVRLAHDNFDMLVRAVHRLKHALAEYEGVGDIADNYPLGKRELKIHLKPEARTLGVTERDLGRQIRAAFYGAEALRLQRGRNEVKVMARYPEEDRKSLWNIDTMRIRTPEGGELPLHRAATVIEDRGFSEINRADLKRVINVTANVDEKVANAEEILEKLKQTILAELVADYPGLTYNLEGEEKERRESMDSMKSGFALALFSIYALLAIPFRSYSQPFLIMTAIPFGIVGAILGHGILGFDISILSIFGVVALSGVVVNDSLLLIDQVNRNREKKETIYHAVIDAGQRRFRPILLTSLTTFFGLTPMIFETSVQAQFLIPMAISLGYGIMFATGITLLLIPTLYMVLEDFHGLLGVRRDQQPIEHAKTV